MTRAQCHHTHPVTLRWCKKEDDYFSLHRGEEMGLVLWRPVAVCWGQVVWLCGLWYLLVSHPLSIDEEN